MITTNSSLDSADPLARYESSHWRTFPDDLLEDHPSRIVELVASSAPTVPARVRFAHTLRALRAAQKISQSELARRAGLTSGYLSKLESGRVPLPPRKTLEMLALSLDVPPAHLSVRSGYLDEELVNYIQSNDVLLEILDEARLRQLDARAWERISASIREEIRLSVLDRPRPEFIE